MNGFIDRLDAEGAIPLWIGRRETQRLATGAG
jgi:hypothetical protein